MRCRVYSIRVAVATGAMRRANECDEGARSFPRASVASERVFNVALVLVAVCVGGCVGWLSARGSEPEPERTIIVQFAVFAFGGGFG